MLDPNALCNDLTLEITVDFNRSFEDAVRAGEYDYLDIASDFSPTSLPSLDSPGSRSHQVLLQSWVGARRRNGMVTICDWRAHLHCIQRGFASPLIVLAIGELRPNTQRAGQIFTFWVDPNDRPWYLSIYECKFGRRLDIDQVQRYGRFSVESRAATVTCNV